MDTECIWLHTVMCAVCLLVYRQAFRQSVGGVMVCYNTIISNFTNFIPGITGEYLFLPGIMFWPKNPPARPGALPFTPERFDEAAVAAASEAGALAASSSAPCFLLFTAAI